MFVERVSQTLSSLLFPSFRFVSLDEEMKKERHVKMMVMMRMKRRSFYLHLLLLHLLLFFMNIFFTFECIYNIYSIYLYSIPSLSVSLQHSMTSTMTIMLSPSSSPSPLSFFTSSSTCSSLFHMTNKERERAKSWWVKQWKVPVFCTDFFHLPLSFLFSFLSLPLLYFNAFLLPLPSSPSNM